MSHVPVATVETSTNLRKQRADQRSSITILVLGDGTCVLCLCSFSRLGQCDSIGAYLEILTTTMMRHWKDSMSSNLIMSSFRREIPLGFIEGIPPFLIWWRSVCVHYTVSIFFLVLHGQSVTCLISSFCIPFVFLFSAAEELLWILILSLSLCFEFFSPCHSFGTLVLIRRFLYVIVTFFSIRSGGHDRIRG